MTYKRLAYSAILVAAALLALFTARPYAGGWNDGSRLAMVESLADRGTFQIDDSVYVRPATSEIPPYTPGDEWLARNGTKDKMLIGGYFYSDKSPLPGVVMAGAYRLLRWCGLPAARERPDWFARVLTWLFAGVPYVLTVWCVGRISRHVGVPGPWDLVLTGGFAFGSLALPYAEHVNNHILLLAVAAAICEAMARASTSPSLTLRAPVGNGARSVSEGGFWLGILAGLGYTIDLGAGPLLAVAAGGWLLWQRRHILAFTAGALPFIAAHHALNYAVAGTLGPANANPEVFQWPGAPFDARNMTGSWQHASVGRAGVYALDLLFGKKGFWLFTLPLVQAVAGTYWLARRQYAERPAVIALGLWAVGTWLLYSATSTNHSGACLSVRWFVPLVVPGFFALLILVRDCPRCRWPVLALVAGSIILDVELVIRGPWWPRVPVLLWPIVGLGLAAWVSVWVRVVYSNRRSDGGTSRSCSTGRRAPSPAAKTG